MKSLILTILYLAKDTLHRWCSRISSPVARVLVVFFLTLAALAGMGSYAISAKIITDRIIKSGADTVMVSAQSSAEAPTLFPTEDEIQQLFGAESVSVLALGSAMGEDGRSIPIYSFEFRRAGQLLPLLNPNGIPTILINAEQQKLSPGPRTITINNEKYDAVAAKLPPQHLLNRLISHQALIILPENLPPDTDIFRGSPILLLRLPQVTSAADTQQVESYFQTYLKLDGKTPNIMSAAAIFSQLEEALSKQLQCRIAFCLGISIIVGILLTALAGIEYRQNEYIYTLMKSFGIRPILLVAAFIAENLLLVMGSAAAALYVFMRSQQFIVTQLLKLGNYSISLPEIMTEIHIIGTTLLACVILSAIPVFVAAHRDIGRVLK